MLNIFLFIRRYFTFLTFLILQGVALWLLFNYNNFHRGKFLGLANEITGRVNSQYNNVEDYFFMKKENRRLHRLNDSLMNLLPSNFELRDTGLQLFKDTIPYDTAGHYRRYTFRTADVVYNTVNAQKNYFQINRGSNQGIRDNMAVLNTDGFGVGVVVNVSPNFSQVMSLLHVQSSVSVSIKKSGEFGTIEWDGKDPAYLTLKGIPKTIDINKGDTVVTSSVSFNFPPGYLIGTIADVQLDNAAGMYLLKVKTAANFNSLQHVHVVENNEYEEQTSLNKETNKNLEALKKNPR